MSAGEHWDFATARDDGWTINDHSADDSVASFLNGLADDQTASCWTLPNCPCCLHPLSTVVFNRDPDESQSWYVHGSYAIQVCNNCKFWQWRSQESTNACMDAPITNLAASVVRRFDLTLPVACSSELAAQLRRDHTGWNTISPQCLERLVADIFRANYSSAEVLHVGRPGDLGVDVIFIDSSAQQWLIQVKRRSQSDRAEGFSTLQQLLGTLVLHGACRGIIATTADYFSAQLLKQQKKAQSIGMTIELLDRGKLNRMLDPLLPDRPWIELLRTATFWDMDDELRRFFLTKIPSSRQLMLFD